jgi:predicted TIM-barrel fold metal-dependent hydrolase
MASDLNRRRLLGFIGAAGTAAAFPFARSLAQAKSHRIDVHHHILSPGFAAALQEQGIRVPAWTVERSLAEMDKSGIATAVTSMMPPGVVFGDAGLARRVAREANEFSVRLARDHPGRFGTFAVLPLHDVEGSLKEIEYAFDTLRVEGFYATTSYGGKYLGDAAFAPVLEELDRRSAVVYTHPWVAACCTKLVPGISDGTIEYATDTTRSIASLVLSGAAAKYPRIRWIFSHSGGAAPFLLSRFLVEEKNMKDRDTKLPKGVLYELAKLYYDTAQGNHAGALAALLKVAPVSQLLYGTDYPFRDGAEVSGGLRAYGFSAADLRAIDRDNALKLMQRLKP